MADKNFYSRIKTLVADDSAKAFAEECGVSPKSIENYLNEKGGIALTNLKKIAKTRKVNVGWLANGELPKCPGEAVTDTEIDSEVLQRNEENLRELGEIVQTMPIQGEGDYKKTLEEAGVLMTKLKADMKIMATITPDHSTGDQDLLKSSTFYSLVAKTIKILDSNTVYRPALAANINAFHQAVEMEGEMKELKTDVHEMRGELAELKDMIISLGGKAQGKKQKAS